MPRNARLTRRKPPKSGIKRNTDTVKSRGHDQWIRGFPCAVQNSDCWEKIDAHHVLTRGAGNGDDKLVPLCRFHHAQWHDMGRETFDKRYGVNLLKLAAELWQRDTYHRLKWENRE